MKIPLLTRLRAIFAKDKEDFWFQYFSDEEIQLRKMDVWQLAKVISEAKTTHVGSEEKRIVAEHLLNIRLANIQANAAWAAGIISFIGAIIGASIPLIAVFYFSQSPQDIARGHESNNENKNMSAPIKETIEPIFRTPKSQPSNAAIEIPPSTQNGVHQRTSPAEAKNK